MRGNRNRMAKGPKEEKTRGKRRRKKKRQRGKRDKKTEEGYIFKRSVAAFVPFSNLKV